MAVDQGQQWLSDPTGRHRFRLFSDGRATEWVADGNDVTEDPLPVVQEPSLAGGTAAYASPDPTVPTSAPVDAGIETPPARPAGWYRNASNPDEIRYWDGTRWTVDPSGAPSPSGGTPPAAVAPPSVVTSPLVVTSPPFGTADRTPATDPEVARPPGRNGTGQSWSGEPARVSDAASGPEDAGRLELRVRPTPTALGNGAAPATAAGPPSAVRADWYPDPANRTRLRYWDGVGWTEHVLDEAPAHRP